MTLYCNCCALDTEFKGNHIIIKCIIIITIKFSFYLTVIIFKSYSIYFASLNHLYLKESLDFLLPKLMTL